jgi:hypothetical protein
VQRHVTGRAVRQLKAALAALQRVCQWACVGGGIEGHVEFSIDSSAADVTA